MPIYEYRCAKCGEFELMRRITDEPLKRCPTCRGKVTKLISNTSFQLKGSGWYATDYAGKKSSPASKSTDSDSKDSKSKDTESKSKDTEPKGKAETKSSDSTSKPSKTAEASA